jgi:DNA-binding XRE family transcriptional regulator
MATARERAGLSQDALAHTLGVTAKTIGHWEGGHSTPRPALRLHLAKLLGFTMDELTRRLGLDIAPDQAALNSNGVGPFEAATGWLPMFVRAEQTAHTIRTLAIVALPALCQTEDYARAIEARGHYQWSPDEVDQLIVQRLDRAAVLDRADFTALIAANLISLDTGEADVMAEQMNHLLNLTGRPNVTLRLIDPVHLAATPGQFTVLGTTGPTADTAAEIGLNGATSHEGPAFAAGHAALFDHLLSLSNDPETSRALIAESADRFAALVTMKGIR